MAGNPTIALINASTVVSDAEVQLHASALAIQANRDFARYWGGLGASVVPVKRGATPPAGSWWVVVADTSDEANALGYHDLTDEGLPIGKVFAKTSKQAGETWTSVASHEIVEMLADPDISTVVLVQTGAHAGKLFARESADPVQEQSYQIGKTWVSNFVTPQWFMNTAKAGPYDHLGKLRKPFTLARGGYISVFDITGGGGWSQLFGDARMRTAALKRAPVGSRRERRSIERDRWATSAPVDVKPRQNRRTRVSKTP